MGDILLKTFLEVRSVTTDTRNLRPNAIFFALRGGRFNGNDFVSQALDAGCPLVVADEDRGLHSDRLLLVPDALGALQVLARDYRRTFRIPVLAITGSNGKTTTKELIRDVLATRFRVHATAGNLNNHIGVPLTLLAMPEETEFAVIEMGANHQKEIEAYCRIAEPGFGLITNIGKAHLEGFGGLEGVRRGKKELYDYLHASGGVIFANTELPELAGITAGLSCVAYGLQTGGQHLRECGDKDRTLSFSLELDSGFRKSPIHTHLAGTYNLWNIASAIAVGRYFEVNPEKMTEAIAGYVPDNNRSQVAETGRNTLILDAYNANPTSMEHALRNLAAQADRRRVRMVIGDMLELGEASAEEHRRILDLAEELGLQGYCVGPRFAELSTGRPFTFFGSAAEAAGYLAGHPLEGYTILLKGSRGIGLEILQPVL